MELSIIPIFVSAVTLGTAYLLLRIGLPGLIRNRREKKRFSLRTEARITSSYKVKECSEGEYYYNHYHKVTYNVDGMEYYTNTQFSVSRRGKDKGTVILWVDPQEPGKTYSTAISNELFTCRIVTALAGLCVLMGAIFLIIWF